MSAGLRIRPYEPLLSAREVAIGPALVIAPHPDDEILGCGGTLALHRAAGHRVVALILTDGAGGDPSGASTGDLVALRKAESEEALRRLGGVESHFWGHPDGRLAEVLGLSRDLAQFIRSVAPSTVFFPSPWEIHPDHRVAALAAMDAAQRIESPPRFLAYEVGAPMPANAIVDITSVMIRKEEAVLAFASQLVQHDLVGKMRAIARARTVNVPDGQVRYAEAFLHLRPDAVQSYLAAQENLLLQNDEICPFPR